MHDLYRVWVVVVIIGNGIAALWALAAHRYPPLRRRELWWWTAVFEVAIFVQVVMSVVLVNKYKYSFPGYHAFYEFVALFAVGILYSYRLQLRPKMYLLYAGGGLFIMGLCIRAATVRL